MIIRKKKYEKLNDDLVDAKAKVDDAKKSLDDENKIMRATILIKEQRDQYKAENEKLKEEVERLNGIIKDEEDWKAIEQEYEEWSDNNDTHT